MLVFLLMKLFVLSLLPPNPIFEITLPPFNALQSTIFMTVDRVNNKAIIFIMFAFLCLVPANCVSKLGFFSNLFGIFSVLYVDQENVLLLILSADVESLFFLLILRL